ncbi:MAG: hypothetical protein ABIP64_09145 [Burkholderiales bacterium]
MATISAAHLPKRVQVYNLRKQTGYQRHRPVGIKTRPVTIPIGERRAPGPNHQPGYLRVDSVHQGDQDGVKGVYPINTFAETITDANGRQRKRYPYPLMMTPYEKLKSLHWAEQFLKPEITFQQLDAHASAISDNEAAQRLNDARIALFKTILKRSKTAA